MTCGPLSADRERNHSGHQRDCGETPHADMVRLFADCVQGQSRHRAKKRRISIRPFVQKQKRDGNHLISRLALRPNPRYRAVLEAYLEKAWREARDPATGSFSLGDVAMSNRNEGISVLDQASFVQMYALLDSFPQTPQGAGLRRELS